MSKPLVRTVLAAIALSCLAGVASAQGVEIFSRQKVTASLEDPWGLDAYRFQAVQGDLLTLVVTASKKTGLVPTVTLFGPDGPVALPDVVGGKLKAKKILMPTTGTYYVGVGGTGAPGDYKLSLTLKGPKLAPITVAVPGEVRFDAPRGALLTAKITAEKGSGIEPGVDSITDGRGEDILDAGALSEKGAKASVKKLECPFFGSHTMALAVRGGSAGNAVVKLKLKAPKPMLKKLGPETAGETLIFKRRMEGGKYFFTVWVENAKAATLRFPPEAEEDDLVLPGGGGQFGLEEEFDDEGALDAAWPEGLYVLVVTLTDGTVTECPFEVGGPFPEHVESVSLGGYPTVSWAGGSGSQLIYVAAGDTITEDDVFGAMLPSTARDHLLPSGLLPPGVPLGVEVTAVSTGHKTCSARGMTESAEVAYNAALSTGDLLTFGLDLGTLRYGYEFVEGMYEGESGVGSLTPIGGDGGYVFHAADDGGEPGEGATVVLLPGSLLLGSDSEGGLFAGLPARDSVYPVEEIVGVYNYVMFGCDVVGENLVCDADIGTFELGDGVWKVWAGSDAKGAEDESGTWTDQGNGILHMYDGEDRVANLMVLPGPDGGKFLVLGNLDGGIVLAARRQSVAPGDVEGVYDVVTTEGSGNFTFTLSGRTIAEGDEEPNPVDFNDPWTGFISGGDEDDGGVGLVTPWGALVVAVWTSDVPPEVGRASHLFAGIKR